nr:immunoglobulin-like domain-containing protein [Exiguobacterium sp. s130]
MIRRVTVKDTIKPVLSGVTNQSINLNSTFDPKKGITAKDNIDGDVTKSIQVSGSVNLKKVGTYTLTYNVADRSGNTTTLVRKITVKDNVKPIITGAKSKTIKYKSSFNSKAGVSAKDNVDGTLTKSIKVTGSVNTKRKGVYPLSYSVKDKAGNSTSVKIKITVK